MLIVQIIEGHHNPVARKVGENTYFTQKIYVDNGGPFPFESKLSIPDASKALPVGQYTLLPSCFQSGKYGDLEINRFDLYQSLAPIIDTSKSK